MSPRVQKETVDFDNRKNHKKRFKTKNHMYQFDGSKLVLW